MTNFKFEAKKLGHNIKQILLKMKNCTLSVLTGSQKVLSLTELAAKEVATSIPFELVEIFDPPVPEQLQLRISSWSFPDQEEDIR